MDSAPVGGVNATTAEGHAHAGRVFGAGRLARRALRRNRLGSVLPIPRPPGKFRCGSRARLHAPRHCELRLSPPARCGLGRRVPSTCSASRCEGVVSHPDRGRRRRRQPVGALSNARHCRRLHGGLTAAAARPEPTRARTPGPGSPRSSSPGAVDQGSATARRRGLRLPFGRRILGRRAVPDGLAYRLEVAGVRDQHAQSAVLDLVPDTADPACDDRPLLPHRFGNRQITVAPVSRPARARPAV
jgi:hypothetical protein